MVRTFNPGASTPWARRWKVTSYSLAHHMHISAIPVFIAMLVYAGQTQAADCKQALQSLGPVAMQMPVDEFDQGATGWRKLGDEGCYAEAALLIERYALNYDSKYRALKWHLAQMHALADNTAAALAAAELSLSPIQEQMHPDFDWNSYVKATIAFLRNDRPGFDQHRAALRSAMAGSAANAPNDEALARLARCFGKPYAQAYRCDMP